MHPGRKLDKKRFAKSDSTRQYQSKDGKICFQGVPGKLRETEIYPPAFGRAVFEMHTVKKSTMFVFPLMLKPVRHGLAPRYALLSRVQHLQSVSASLTASATTGMTPSNTFGETRLG